MADIQHDTGTFRSGDVTIFYRKFGRPGATPILFLHGAMYFDSADWIEVAGALATDREAVAWDRRGFGNSSWSPNADYSLDALAEDFLALLDHMGWDKVIVSGHSMSGRVAIVLAAKFPDKVAGLMVLDSALGGGPQRGGTGNEQLIFPTLEEGMAHFAARSNPPRVGKDRARAEQAFNKTERGYELKRDPDFGNGRPEGRDLTLESQPVMEALGRVRCPTLLIRGLKSDRFTDESIAKFRADFPHIAVVEVESEHDLAYQARDAVIAAIRQFASGLKAAA